MNIFKKYREAAELSQSEVAKRMGYSTPQFISNWEREVSTPPVKDIVKLAGIYKVSPFAMLDYLEDLEMSEVRNKFEKIRSKIK